MTVDLTDISAPDVLDARAGVDAAAFSAGARDLLIGKAGNDRLVGGGGRDRAVGGEGRDTCRGERRESCER